MTDPCRLLRKVEELATSLGPAIRPAGSGEVPRAPIETARQLLGAAAYSPPRPSDDETALVDKAAAGIGAAAGNALPAGLR